MKNDLYGSEDEEEYTKGRDHLFLWTVGILLLIGVTLATWLGTYYIFGHPEKPESYAILQKLNKLEPPVRYPLTKAPPGEFLTAKKAYERYSAMSAYELNRLNEGLLRDYIRNYQSTKRLVPYLTGRYSIMGAYELGDEDFFRTGMVAVAQSVDVPQMVLEHVYPAAARVVPVLEGMLGQGLDIQLERMTDLAALIHVARTPDGRMQFTVVPLLYGSYALAGHGSFTLEPPALLNPSGGLPMVREDRFMETAKSYVAYLQKTRMGGAVAAGGTPSVPVARAASETTIVRVDMPPESAPEAAEEVPAEAGNTEVAQTAVEITGELQPPVVLNEEDGTDVVPPAPTPPPVPASVAGMSPRPEPARPVSTPRVAVALPASTPPRAASSGGSASVAPPAPTPAPATAAATPLLQPFLAASPTPGAAARQGGGSWRTYSAGQMPRGRLVDLAEVTEMAERGFSGERTYLQGDFVVTVAGDNRAVLRSNRRLSGVIGSVMRQPAVRVIVDFPEGSVPPEEKSHVSRDVDRPFEVREIQRGSDGTINVYVREITR